MNVSVIQQAKIQAQVLVPLIKALQKELGSERANDLVRQALGDLYRRYGEEFWRKKNEKNLARRWLPVLQHSPATTRWNIA